MDAELTSTAELHGIDDRGRLGGGHEVMEVIMTKNRLILIAVLIVAIAACAKTAKSRRESEWRGLTEREARSKLDAKLPGMIPAEKRSAISDKVVAKMRERGVLSDNLVVPDDASGLTDELAKH